jgi:hypothetical protein
MEKHQQKVEKLQVNLNTLQADYQACSKGWTI